MSPPVSEDNITQSGHTGMSSFNEISLISHRVKVIKPKCTLSEKINLTLVFLHSDLNRVSMFIADALFSLTKMLFALQQLRDRRVQKHHQN